MSTTALQAVATRLAVNEQELQNIVMNTIMPNKGNNVSNEQFLSFMSVANEYKLNPLTKEIYAFPAKGGGIQPIVSIDGWLKIINTHPDFDGMEFKDNVDANGNLISITCRMYRKERKHPTEMTEYLNECKKNTEPWNQWPSRMLRHKATIQAARYAFGLSGIIDPDEAERYQDQGVIEKDVTPQQQAIADHSDKFPVWLDLVSSGKKTAQQLIEFLAKKNIALTEEQQQQLFNAEAIDA